MEANKDAALHYIELAERAILANDYERALRYLNKSESLFPTQKAKDLIERLMHTNSYSSSTNHKSPDQPSSNSNNHADHSSNPNSNGASSTTRQRSNTNTNSAPSSDYTPEEAQAVRKIKTCKDLYEILGVSKTASEADLKKGYRKLALQFHPDKCKAPGATDAFKAIGKAFSILSDPKKREQYDQYGHAMEPQYHRSSNGAGHSSHNYHYYDDDEDFSAEEIFNLFFGYTGGNTRSYRRRQSPFHFSTHSTGNHSQSTTHTLAQLLPYLLLFLVSILGTFLVSEPQFQLHRTGKYSHHRQTRLSNIDYYVKADFRAPKIQSELDQFESAVVDEYVSDIRHQCYREEQYKESMLWRARMMNDQNLYHQAQKQGTPSCTKLNNFVRTGRA